MNAHSERREDPYARADYRRLIAWSARIEREAPLLLRLLDAAPDRSVLDLGCGTGEHTAFFAQAGARAVGVDASDSMLAAAAEHAAAGRGRFVAGDMRALGAVLGDEPPFGLAVCLGNVLPHLLEGDDLDALLRGVRTALRPGGILLVQLLNYEGIRAAGKRHLPVDVRPGDGGAEIVFLRLMKDAGDERMLFFPTTLELHPDDEEQPVRVVRSRRVVLRAWTRADLEPRLRAAGFEPEWLGDMQGGAFDPLRSTDLVVLARATGASPAG